MPARHRTMATDVAPAYPPLPLSAATGGPIRIAASRTRPPAFVTALAEDIGAELVPMGSAGVKIAAVVNGDADAYVHAGGQYEWDSAAPVAVALATGLHASRIDGSALEYNQGDPKLPDLVVCRKDLAPRLLAAIKPHLPR
jgi:3'(2'), 5'-bisphosphate nucleotidase